MSSFRPSEVSFFEPLSNDMIPTGERSLKEIYEMVKSPLLAKETKICRNAAPKEALKVARNVLPFITPSGTFKQRDKKAIKSNSGFFAIAIDEIHPEDIEKVKKRILGLTLIPTALIFTSYSGRGIEWIIPMPKNFKTTRNAYTTIVSHLNELGIKADALGGSITRPLHLCNDPKAIFNSAVNPHSYSLPLQDARFNSELEKLPNNGLNKEPISSIDFKEVEFLVQQIESFGKQFLDDNHDWQIVGLALANILGEEGRSLFHRLSALGKKREFNQITTQFNESLKNKSGEHNLSTLFHLATSAGIDLVPFKIPGEAKLPLFPPELDQLLPKRIQDILESESRRDLKDALLIGTITALSSILTNISGLYHEDRVQPLLFSLILGAPASGKGKLAALKNLVLPLHNEWKQLFTEELERYLKEKQLNPKLELRAPVRRLLLIPANNSSAGLISLLDRNDGVGLIFETEADTLIEALKKEFGSFSDLIRKGFHHESYSFFRKTDQEYSDIPNPCFSILLTGTYDQLLKLIPKENNGTFSRYCFYFLTESEPFKNPFQNPEFDRKEYMKNIGLQIDDAICELQNGQYSFHLTNDQAADFSSFFIAIEKNSTSAEFMHSVIKRHALMGFRMMMVLSTLEIVEEREALGEKIICTEKAFQAVKLMLPTLLAHASHAHDMTISVSKTKLSSQQKNENIQLLLRYLPQSFSRQQYLKIAHVLEIAKSTAERYLDNDNLGSKVIRIDKGTYEKMA